MSLTNSRNLSPSQWPGFVQLGEAVSDAVVVLDGEGRIHHGNAAARELPGFPLAGANDFAAWVVEEDRPRVREAVALARVTPQSVEHCRLREWSGRLFTCELGLSALDAHWILLVARNVVVADSLSPAGRDWQSSAERAGRSGTFEWLIPQNEVRWSAELEELYGLRRGGGGRSTEAWLTLLQPADASRVREELIVALRERREDYNCEFRVALPSGGFRWIAGQGRIVYGAGDEPLRMLGINLDIDARKRKELRSEFVLHMALTLRPLADPGAIADTTVRVLREQLNADRCAYARCESDEDTFEVLGNCATGLPPMVGKFRLSDFGSDVLQTQREGQPYVVEDAEISASTDTARALFRANGIRAAVTVPLLKEGRLRAGVAVHHATPRVWTADELELIELAANACWESIERARAARRLEASERRLRLALTAARMVAWELDPHTGKADVLDNAAEVFGLPPNASLDDTEAGFALVHPDDEAAHRALFGRTIAEGGSHVTHFRMLRPGGRGVIWIEERAYALCDERGKATRFVGVMIDITDRKEAENQLHAAHALLSDKAAHLESLVKERTASLEETIGELEAFSYSIAHDLRGPLRSMIGFANILIHDHADTLNEEARSHLRRIASAAERMDRLTRDVLHYSSIVRTKPEPEPVDAHALVRDLLETYPALSPDVADIRVQGTLPAVLANAALLTQVFSNLLENAVKFVAPGVSPLVRVSAERHEGRVRFLIEDNGIGIPAQFREKIFGVFERLHTHYVGTGIGLAIVKKAVERMRGTLGVTSGGQGSTFWFELPAA